MTKLEFYRSACVREVNLVARYIAKKSDYPMKNGGRNHCGFLYTLEGTETYRFADRTLDTPPHSITFIPRGEVYSIDFCEERGAVIAFDFELADAPQIRPFCVRLSKDNPLRALFSDAETKWLLKKPETEADLKAIFYKILSSLIRSELYYASGENRMKIAAAFA